MLWLTGWLGRDSRAMLCIHGFALLSAVVLAIPLIGAPASAAGDAAENPRTGRQKPAIVNDTPANRPAPLLEPTHSVPLAVAYCEAIRDKAMEARFAFQAAHLEMLAKQVEAQLTKLDARSAEVRQWVSKREEFSAQATAHLVGIFSAMRPESAADQLVRLDANTAAAILMKLDQRAASAILNDMSAEKAARLAAIMGNFARKSAKDVRP